MLASHAMKTLYLRNVPNEVTERLESLAARAGLSVSRVAIRELGEVARRADRIPTSCGARLLGSDLPDIDVSAGSTVIEPIWTPDAPDRGARQAVTLFAIGLGGSDA